MIALVGFAKYIFQIWGVFSIFLRYITTFSITPTVCVFVCGGGGGGGGPVLAPDGHDIH